MECVQVNESIPECIKKRTAGEDDLADFAR